MTKKREREREREVETLGLHATEVPLKKKKMMKPLSKVLFV